MLKFFLNMAGLATARLPDLRNGGDSWIRDPLAHPDIAAMDERQRADLPFGGFARARVNTTGSDNASAGCDR